MVIKQKHELFKFSFTARFRRTNDIFTSGSMVTFYSRNKALTKTKFLQTKINQLNVNMIIPINYRVILKYNNGVLLLSSHVEKKQCRS